MKVHLLTDVHADTAKFVKMSEAKLHDKNFLKHLILPEGSMILFDKAYNHYLQFAQWTEESVFFVCRLKDNAKYEAAVAWLTCLRRLRCRLPTVMKIKPIRAMWVIRSFCG